MCINRVNRTIVSEVSTGTRGGGCWSRGLLGRTVGPNSAFPSSVTDLSASKTGTRGTECFAFFGSKARWIIVAGSLPRSSGATTAVGLRHSGVYVVPYRVYRIRSCRSGGLRRLRKRFLFIIPGRTGISLARLRVRTMAGVVNDDGFFFHFSQGLRFEKTNFCSQVVLESPYESIDLVVFREGSNLK